MQIIAALVCGFIFGLGLVIAGMVNPAKVLNFLDLAGTWDPTLAFVLAGAVVTTAIGYRIALRRAQPLLEARFSLPTRADIDVRLIAGAALFGIGWGLAGLCPGPAFSALIPGSGSVEIFLAAMLAGMALTRLATEKWN